MSKNRGNTISALNTGKHIQSLMKQKNQNMADLARMLKRHQSVATRIARKSSVQAYLLWELSLALKHNFFSDLAQQLEQSAGADAFDNAQNHINTQLTLLENEN